VFNIQGKITVHFHTRVYIHTGQAQWQYCKWGSWGGEQQSPLGAPFHQLPVWGSTVSSPSGVRGRALATNRFFTFWCAQNGSPTQHEAPEHAWGPPDRGVWGVLPPALPVLTWLSQKITIAFSSIHFFSVLCG